MHVFDPRAVAGQTLGEFDNVDYVDGLPGLVAHPQPTVVPQGASLLVSGWTVDPVTNGPPAAVCVYFDRALPFYARTGIARGDIMLKHGTDEFVGYQLVVPTAQLSCGPHELRTFALSSDGRWYESALAGFRVYAHHRAVRAKDSLQRELRIVPETPHDLATLLPIPLGTPIYANRSVLLRGWAFDEELGIGTQTMVASHADGRTWSGPANIERPLVREALSAGDDRLGFEIAIPAAVFGRGRHTLQLSGLDASGRQYPNSVDIAFDVISAERPFPLTARLSHAALDFAARLRIADEARDAILPSEAPIPFSPAQQVVIVGWALDETGEAADEVFIELSAHRLALPPRRRPALSARESAADALPPAPLRNAWFSIRFEMPASARDSYDLALVVVQPGRRSYTRAPLATLQIASMLATSS